MGHPRLSDEEIDRRGEALYDQRIRSLVETPTNLGKQIVIDVETGEYEIDRCSGRPMRNERPGSWKT